MASVRNVPQNPSTENNHSKQLDDFWTELLLLLIGEAFDQSGAGDLVNGAVVNIRGKGDKASGSPHFTQCTGLIHTNFP